MNLGREKNYGLSNLTDLLEEIGIPSSVIYSNSNDSASINMSMVLIGMKKYVNIDYFFSVSVGTTYKNRSLNQIYLSKPQLDAELFPE